MKSTYSYAGLIALLAFLSALGQFGANVFLSGLPAIEAELSVTSSAAAASYTVYLLVFGAIQLVAGPLADRIGRRPVALGSVLVFLIGSLACAVAPNLSFLIAARMVQAIGAAGSIVISRAVARDRFTGPQLVRVTSTIMMSFALVPGFAPLLGGLLTAEFGWRSTLVACAALGAITLAWSWRSLAESMPGQAAASRFSPIQAYSEVLHNRTFVRMAIVAGTAYGGLLAFFGAAPRLYISKLGFSAVQFGFFPVIVVFCFFAGAIYLRKVSAAGSLGERSKLSEYSGIKHLLRLGTGVQVIAVFVMLVPAAFGWLSAWPLNIGIGLYVAALGLISPLASASAMNSQATQVGLAAALLGFMQMMTGALGAWLAHVLSDFSSNIGMQAAMLTMVLTNFAIVSTWATLKPRA